MADTTMDEFYNLKAGMRNDGTTTKNNNTKKDESETEKVGKEKFLDKLKRYGDYTKIVVENLEVMVGTEKEAIEKLKKVNVETDKFYKYGIKGEKMPNDIDVYTITSINELFKALVEKKERNLNDFIAEQKKLEKNIAYLEADITSFNMYGKAHEARKCLAQLNDLNEAYKDVIERMLTLEQEYQRTKVHVNEVMQQNEKVKQELLKGINRNGPNKER